jgi:hypothetical protein
MTLGWVDVGSVVVEETGVSKFDAAGCVGVCIAVLLQLRLMKDDSVLGGSTLSGW